jgi:hypothetical protein
VSEEACLAWVDSITYKFQLRGRGMTVRCEGEVTTRRQREAIKRRGRGEPVREIARSYNVHGSTISRLAA